MLRSFCCETFGYTLAFAIVCLSSSTRSSMSFHFTSTAPSSQLLADVQALNSWSTDTLTAFTPVLLAYLGQSASQDALLTAFLGAHPGEGKKARSVLRSLLGFFAASMRAVGGADEKHVQADLVALGLTADRASVLSTGCLSSLAELSAAAAEKTLHVNQLYDIQWKFGVSAVEL